MTDEDVADPGNWFEYDQSTVSLLTELVARAAGTDFQTFLQRELFGTIGIAPGTWSWTRGHHHHTLGFMGLQLRPADYARLGQLMLDGGSWNGRQLVDADYVKAATSSSPSNPGYGWFWWLDAGTSFIGPTGRARDVHDRRIVESAPPDMFTAAGLGDQLVMVIPSLDLVLTRESRVSRSGAGPAVARAAIVGGSGVRLRAVAARLDRHGAATFAISCPPVASVACAGTVTLQRSGRSASAAARYRAARGRRVHVRVTAGEALRAGACAPRTRLGGAARLQRRAGRRDGDEGPAGALVTARKACAPARQLRGSPIRGARLVR